VTEPFVNDTNVFMREPIQVTHNTVPLLRALCEQRRLWYGYELAQHTGLRSATLGVLLHRLVEIGWAARQQESEQAWRARRARTARRTYFILTDEGATGARRILKDQDR